MRKTYTVISSTYVPQPAMGKRPARTWLAGVALLTAREQWGKWRLDIQSGVALVGDNVWDVPLWVSRNLNTPTTLVGWRLDDIVVPSLIAAADTCGDPAIARECLRSLEGALTDNVIDLAATQGGAALHGGGGCGRARTLALEREARRDLAHRLPGRHA